MRIKKKLIKNKILLATTFKIIVFSITLTLFLVPFYGCKNEKTALNNGEENKENPSVIPENGLIPDPENLYSRKIDNKWGFADIDGNIVIPAIYKNVGFFEEGLAPVELVNRWWGRVGKWGYVDATGTMVIPAIYSDAGSFSEGLAFVELQNKYGYIDLAGEMVIPAIYTLAYSFRDGKAQVLLGKKEVYIDQTGQPIP